MVSLQTIGQHGRFQLASASIVQILLNSAKMSEETAESWDAEQIEPWQHDQLLLMQELGDDYYKIHNRNDQDSEEDQFEEEERVRWQEEEEEAKAKYFKMIEATRRGNGKTLC